MILTLTITASSATKPGEAVRHVFTEAGGSIGRAATNSWVLTQNKVSGRHAAITCRDGVFYIQDMSRNGISVNSPYNRLVSGRPYALKAGDRILIEPYEIDVEIDAGAERVEMPFVDPLGDLDPFAQAPGAAVRPPELPSPLQGAGSGEVDPLKFFDPLSGAGPKRHAKSDVHVQDDWHQAHYSPPPILQDPDAPPSGPGAIPQGYNPLAPDEPPAPPPPRRPARAPVEATPAFAVPRPGAAAREPVVPAPPPVAPVRIPPPEPPKLAVPPAPRVHLPEGDVATSGLTEVLVGAGLPASTVTPELAHNIGQIVRVVVAGLMDILQARQRIKDEFGMDRTVFRPADNNPLKFSANVEDALHNLLVKRNAAYLGPVDAFADAFDDLRDHQLAILAGMRVAFEGMLADFDPDRLQQEFDRQLSKGGLQVVPAKMRYWEMLREKRREMLKDPEKTFASLFGDAFAQAYEEQLDTLKARRRDRAGHDSPDLHLPRE